MKISLTVLSLILCIQLPLLSEDVVLSNELIKISVNPQGETLIKQIEYLPRSLTNLREVVESESMLFFTEEEDRNAGVRIIRDVDDKESVVIWEVLAKSDHQVNLRSLDKKWRVSIVLPEKALYADVKLKPEFELAEPIELSMVFMLEVAGTFLGVPTEGPADYQILPVLDGLDRRISSIPIHRDTDERYSLALPWWGVGDRVANLTLACSIHPVDGRVSIHQWSGMVQAHEAFRQTMTFGIAKEVEEIRVRLHLFDQLSGLSALSEKMGWWIRHNERNPEMSDLVIAPIEFLPQGEILILADGELMDKISVSEWQAGEVYTHSLKEGVGRRRLIVKWQSATTEETELLSEIEGRK